MEKIIISDTTCLILLSKLGKLELLKMLFSTVIITPEIQQEYNDRLPEWIHIESVVDQKRFSFLKTILDEGEASAIALCLETPKSLLILDERKGRKLATDLGLPIIGTLGVLLEAKTHGYIPSMQSVVEQILASDFRISPELLNEILIKSGEPPFV